MPSRILCGLPCMFYLLSRPLAADDWQIITPSSQRHRCNTVPPPEPAPSPRSAIHNPIIIPSSFHVRKQRSSEATFPEWLAACRALRCHCRTHRHRSRDDGRLAGVRPHEVAAGPPQPRPKDTDTQPDGQRGSVSGVASHV